MKTSSFKRIALLSLAVAAATLATGCATRPSSISAAYVSHEKYTGRTCEQLGGDMVHAREQLEDFSSKQNTRANVDAATVFFTLVPASALAGDNKADVAQWKGEVEAISTAQIRAGCTAVR